MIKFIFRWAFRLLILGIVLVVALLLLKDTILKSVAESQIRKATGMDVKIGAISVSLTQPIFNLENFVLYNTAEFGGGPFIDVPDLHLEFYPDATRKRELQFKLVRMHVRELNIVESADGRTNITSIAGALEKMQSGSTNKDQSVFKGIDTLNLSVGKVRYISLRQPRQNQEINLALQNEVVKNVRSWNDMAGILFKVIVRAGVTFYFDQPRRAAPVSPLPPTNSPPQRKSK
jgi:hypothetical protein